MGKNAQDSLPEIMYIVHTRTENIHLATENLRQCYVHTTALS